ncbi:MAG: (alpha)-aspartyl dipeptidase [Gemmatimonas sp. SG8_17]|nr:MAG: (alpha)-aspartyl dipeptidase [Gemmatimonas sp. SG8_17]
MTRQLLLISTSTVHGSGYLDYCASEIRAFLPGAPRVLFVPYARPSGLTHDEYTQKASEKFAKIGLELVGIHAAPDPAAAVRGADALFVGGGNTFLLLNQLYSNNLMDPIRKRVADGLPYVGTSAGSNVAGATIGTTNDMPIVYPPSFDALRLVPFNLNPHYLDPDPHSTHRGETRETRIQEFHSFNAQPVVGLREGAMLHVAGNSVHLQGSAGARLFRRDAAPEELVPGGRLDFLLA